MSITLLNEPKATPSQPLEKVLFTSGGTVTIKAPADVVFSVITGFSKYSEWNSWTPVLKFEESDAQVKSGCKGQLKSEMKDQGKSYDIPLKILELSRSPEEYRLSWRSELLPWWSFGAERVHVVTPLPDDPTSCIVSQWESMSGGAAYAFKYLMGVPKQLDDCNQKYMEELKAYAESL